MHEWGIALNIIEKIKNTANINGIHKVTSAQIKLGRSLHIGVSEFRDCLVVLAKEENLEQCLFDIEEVDSKLASLESIEGE